MLKALNATLNRRRLLMGLAAASTAAATAGTVAALEAAAPENAELIRLADDLPAVRAEVVAANEAVRASVREWGPRWPSIPDEIIASRGQWVGNYRARDLTGYGVDVNGEPVRLHRKRDLEQEAKRLRRLTATIRPRHPLTPAQIAEMLEKAAALDALAVKAGAYQDECDRVKAASGYDAAKARQTAAGEALAALVGAIIGQPAETMAGVLIKAEALEAWQSVRLRAFVPESWDWPGVLAADVLRIAARSA